MPGVSSGAWTFADCGGRRQWFRAGFFLPNKYLDDLTIFCFWGTREVASVVWEREGVGN